MSEAIKSIVARKLKDADTGVSHSGETLRFSGYDAPEKGSIAEIVARNITKATLAKDPEHEYGGQDRYGRHLVDVPQLRENQLLYGPSGTTRWSDAQDNTNARTRTYLQQLDPEGHTVPADMRGDYLQSIALKDRPNFPKIKIRLGYKPGVMESSWERGKGTLQMNLGMFGKAMGDLIGSEAMQNWGWKHARRGQRHAQKYLARVKNFDEVIDDPSKFITYVTEAMVENAPNLLVDLGAGIATGGSAVVAKRLGWGLLKDQVFSKGMQAGMAGAIYPQMVGETKMQMHQEGIESDIAPFITGVAKTGAELYGLNRLVRSSAGLLKVPPKTVAEFARRLTKEAATQFGVEGGTETFQQALDFLTLKAIDSDYDIFTEENWDELRESFWRGGFAGGGTAAVTGAATGSAGMLLSKGSQPLPEESNDDRPGRSGDNTPRDPGGDGGAPAGDSAGAGAGDNPTGTRSPGTTTPTGDDPSVLDPSESDGNRTTGQNNYGPDEPPSERWQVAVGELIDRGVTDKRELGKHRGEVDPTTFWTYVQRKIQDHRDSGGATTLRTPGDGSSVSQLHGRSTGEDRDTQTRSDDQIRKGASSESGGTDEPTWVTDLGLTTSFQDLIEIHKDTQTTEVAAGEEDAAHSDEWEGERQSQRDQGSYNIVHLGGWEAGRQLRRDQGYYESTVLTEKDPDGNLVPQLVNEVTRVAEAVRAATKSANNSKGAVISVEGKNKYKPLQLSVHSIIDLGRLIGQTEGGETTTETRNIGTKLGDWFNTGLGAMMSYKFVTLPEYYYKDKSKNLRQNWLWLAVGAGRKNRAKQTGRAVPKWKAGKDTAYWMNNTPFNVNTLVSGQTKMGQVGEDFDRLFENIDDILSEIANQEKSLLELAIDDSESGKLSFEEEIAIRRAAVVEGVLEWIEDLDKDQKTTEQDENAVDALTDLLLAEALPQQEDSETLPAIKDIKVSKSDMGLIYDEAQSIIREQQDARTRANDTGSMYAQEPTLPPSDSQSDEAEKRAKGIEETMGGSQRITYGPKPKRKAPATTPVRELTPLFRNLNLAKARVDKKLAKRYKNIRAVGGKFMGHFQTALFNFVQNGMPESLLDRVEGIAIGDRIHDKAPYATWAERLGLIVIGQDKPGTDVDAYIFRLGHELGHALDYATDPITVQQMDTIGKELYWFHRELTNAKDEETQEIGFRIGWPHVKFPGVTTNAKNKENPIHFNPKIVDMEKYRKELTAQVHSLYVNHPELRERVPEATKMVEEKYGQLQRSQLQSNQSDKEHGVSGQSVLQVDTGGAYRRGSESTGKIGSYGEWDPRRVEGPRDPRSRRLAEEDDDDMGHSGRPLEEWPGISKDRVKGFIRRLETTAPAKLAMKIVNQYILDSDNALQDIPGGKWLANQFHHVTGSTHKGISYAQAVLQQQGPYTARLHRIITKGIPKPEGLKKANPQEWMDYNDKLAQQSKRIASEIASEKVREGSKAEQIQELLEDFRNYLNQEHRKIQQARGGKSKKEWILYRKNYFPHLYSTYMLEEQGARFEELLREYHEELSEKDIPVVRQLLIEHHGTLELLSEDKSMALPIGMRHAHRRKIKIPTNILLNEGFIEHDLGTALPIYIHQGVRALEWERRFGTYVEMEIKPGKTVPVWQRSALINEHFDKMRKMGATLDEITLAKQIVLGHQGRLGMDMSQKWQHRQQWFTTFLYWNILPFAMLSSLIDVVGIVVRNDGDFRTAAQSLAKAVNAMRQDKSSLIETLEWMGTITEQHTAHALHDQVEFGGVMGSSGRWTERLFHINGLHAFTKMTRIASTIAASDFIKKHSKLAKQNNKESKHFLQELGITTDHVDAWFSRKGDERLHPSLAKHKEMISALNQFVDESILRPNPALRPMKASDPKLALVYMLKGFMYAFTKQILGRVYHEMVRKHGEHGMSAEMLAPLAYASSAIPFAALGVMLKDTLKYIGSDEEPPERELLDYISRSGLLGPIEWMIDVRYGYESEFPIIGAVSPAFSYLVDATDQELKTTLSKSIPGVSWSAGARNYVQDF